MDKLDVEFTPEDYDELADIARALGISVEALVDQAAKFLIGGPRPLMPPGVRGPMRQRHVS